MAMEMDDNTLSNINYFSMEEYNKNKKIIEKTNVEEWKFFDDIPFIYSIMYYQELFGIELSNNTIRHLETNINNYINKVKEEKITDPTKIVYFLLNQMKTNYVFDEHSSNPINMIGTSKGQFGDNKM